MAAPSRSIPAPGEAVPPAQTVAEILRRNGVDAGFRDHPALLFGERRWNHGELFGEACRWANLFLSELDRGRPPHVGVLLDNTPDYLFALAGAALAGVVVVGMNHTRQGDQLLRDLTRTDVQLLVTEPRHLHRVEPFLDRLPFRSDRLLVSRRFATGEDEGAPELGRALEPLLQAAPGDDPVLDIEPKATWMLIFTSGTSSAPKAVVCSQLRLATTGTRLGIALDVGRDDVGYICMPLFHSNALMVGWAPAIVYGAAVGLARRFSASGWLPDVRRYGATYFNYTGKPLSYLVSTPERPDDADNTLRIAYGNEGSPEVVARFASRFDVEVIDAFGATEGGISVSREGAIKPGAMGIAGEHISIVDEDGNERALARFDEQGRLANADECVGEIVNTTGAGPFEGYYNNPEANAKTLRNGWYWSGDLGYLDADRNLYFAGRNADWIRVDGENFPAGPIESALSRHDDVVIAAVYGVPDEQAGDQVMAALVMRDGSAFDPVAFASWVDALDDVGPKWRPRYVRVAQELPSTGTNKVVKRTLVHQKFRHDRVGDDELFVRPRGASGYEPFDAAAEEELRAAFVRAGRERFWDL